jgi:hypothetical protein
MGMIRAGRNVYNNSMNKRILSTKPEPIKNKRRKEGESERERAREGASLIT